MAKIGRYTLAAMPQNFQLYATGGVAQVRAEYADGKRTGESMKRNGVDLRRVTGLAVSYGNQGLDGATIETTTPLEEVQVGTIFRAEGECEINVRADASPGFNGGSPRAWLELSVFVEKLVPVGNVSEILTKSSSSRRAEQSA